MGVLIIIVWLWEGLGARVQEEMAGKDLIWTIWRKKTIGSPRNG